MQIRPPRPTDRTSLHSLVRRIDTFTRDEQDVALELIDLALPGGHPDYELLVADLADGSDSPQIGGWLCFGPTPMTTGTVDLYWIGSDPALRGKGIGKALVAAFERVLKDRGSRLVRVETSSTEQYGGTHAFYAATGFVEEARIRDFYRVGDDLIVLTKRV